MKSRGLMAFVIASMLGLFSTFAFAKKATPLSGGQAKKAAQAVSVKTSPVSLSFYTNGRYSLSGTFSDPYNSDRLVQKGLGFGAGCYYTHNHLRLGTGWEFYNGRVELDHEEPGLNGSLFFDEIGVKPWINTALILDGLEVGITAGVQKTATSKLQVKDLYLDPGGGWLNLGLFASEELLSNVDLKIWEVELNTAFKLNRNVSLMFGLLWQKYDINLHIDFNMYGQEVLEVLAPNIETTKEVHISQDLVFLMPGVKWCKGKKFCASTTIPWAVFSSDAWSLGGVVEIEYKF